MPVRVVQGISLDLGFRSGVAGLWYLTLPLIKPTTIYVVTISVYLVFQKYLIGGMTAGAVKG